MVGASAHTSSSTATARGLLGSESEEEEEEECRSGRWFIWWHRETSRSTRRAAATILQPALARLRQKSLPSPAEAPVTITTFPLSSAHASHSCVAICLLWHLCTDTNTTREEMAKLRCEGWQTSQTAPYFWCYHILQLITSRIRMKDLWNYLTYVRHLEKKKVIEVFMTYFRSIQGLKIKN